MQAQLPQPDNLHTSILKTRIMLQYKVATSTVPVVEVFSSI